LSFLTPDEVAALLTARDIVVVDDVGRRDQVEPSLWERSDGLCPHELGRVVRAVLRPARPRR
jgi:hypothetical protein